MLRQRLITALILIPLIAGAVLFLNTLWFAIVFGLIVALGAWEWSHLAGIRNISVRAAYLSIGAALTGLCFVYRSNQSLEAVIGLAVIWWLLATALIVAVQKQVWRLPASRLLKALAGLLVLIPAWFSLLLLREDEYVKGSLVLFLFVLIWVADSAAFFCGRRWGKSRLCSRISPGKTVEGVFGALFASAVLALAYAVVNNVQGIEIAVFIFICLITVLISISGDLMVSMMKRAENLKDSGHLLPGHGGILDRIDSLTAAAPVFYAGLRLWDNWR